eukprot:TRINITY_DN1139_c0_g2_i1.p1 TRINITY_DN1139_c0_g2~~TRINITY_DN1139_c0_g2_i1.p1  ORF type:complete len:359 (+),score=151.81 TRINITY_DN1139_c0_g2_i1:305-1381(+)
MSFQFRQKKSRNDPRRKSFLVREVVFAEESDEGEEGKEEERKEEEKGDAAFEDVRVGAFEFRKPKRRKKSEPKTPFSSSSHTIPTISTKPSSTTSSSSTHDASSLGVSRAEVEVDVSDPKEMLLHILRSSMDSILLLLRDERTHPLYVLDTWSEVGRRFVEAVSQQRWEDLCAIPYEGLEALERRVEEEKEISRLKKVEDDLKQVLRLLEEEEKQWADCSSMLEDMEKTAETRPFPWKTVDSIASELSIEQRNHIGKLEGRAFPSREMVEGVFGRLVGHADDVRELCRRGDGVVRKADGLERQVSECIYAVRKEQVYGTNGDGGGEDAVGDGDGDEGEIAKNVLRKLAAQSQIPSDSL